MTNLTNVRICVEKPLPDEEHIMKYLSDKSNSQHHFQKLSAAFLTQKMWSQNAIITVSFVYTEENIKNVNWTPISILKGMKNSDGNPIKLDPIEKEIRKLSPIKAIKKIVMERIQPIVGLKFIFVEKNGYVRVGFNPHGGSFSLVGTDCIKSKEKVTMNFGWLDAGTIMHEFGHVLGLIHEHQNPKGVPIPWNNSKVYEWAKQTQNWDEQTTYHNIIERYKTNQINGSKYDKYSIMEYFFPASLTTNNKGTPNNHMLSKTDIEYISNVYPGGRMSPEEFYKINYGNSSEKSFKFIIYMTVSIAILLLLIYIYIYV